jgi:esterase/lipase superfamily enzyme
MGTDDYWGTISNAVRGARPGEQDALVFLHGYNVSFRQAALRAAQLGCDLGVTGVMAFYSWPSQGTFGAYTVDEATIEASEVFITEYLTSMVARSEAEKVHIIAHSMGNRALARAMDRIATSAAEQTQVRFNQIILAQIILAAADIDQDTFRQLGMAYQKVADRTTMYVCSKDKAVEASHWLHEYPRAGLAPPVLVVPGIDTINVSNLDLSLLGHGYVAEARDVLQDMHRLIREGTAPERRFGLRRAVTPDGDTYWAIGR